MYFLYSTLFTFALVALLPRFLYQAIRHRKYVEGFAQRLGAAPRTTGDQQLIWLHCVSVGEVMAARPLIAALKTSYPSHAVVVSTTTATGQRVARDVFKEQARNIFYFPLDLPWSVARSLDRIRPSLILLMETEIWPNFIRAAARKSIPTAIVNGRISNTSFKRYALIKNLLRHVLADLSLAIMQTADDAARLKELGASPERVCVSGNLKYDADEYTDERHLTDSLRDRFDFAESAPLIVAASTHAPEEQIVIEVFKSLLTSDLGQNARLVIAPRHPERFDEVAALLAQASVKWTRRTAPAHADDRNCDVVLLDTIGELRAVFPLAQIVFVGGSIAPRGGHNVLEPAAASRCIIVGADTSNFAEIVRAFIAERALVQLPPVAEESSVAAEMLAERCTSLLADEAMRIEYGARARKVFNSYGGASERTARLLAPLIERSTALAGDHTATSSSVSRFV